MTDTLIKWLINDSIKKMIKDEYVYVAYLIYILVLFIFRRPPSCVHLFPTEVINHL